MAVRGECGRFPILLEVISNMFRHWEHMQTSKNILLQDAAALSDSLRLKGVDSWFNSLHSVMGYLNINIDIGQRCIKNVHKLILTKLINLQI